MQTQEGNDLDFPQYLSAPLQVLWFESDDIGMMFLFWFIIMVVLDLSIKFLPLVGVGAWLYISTKKNKPRGFFRHVLYQFGFISLRNYPAYLENIFHE